MSELDFHSLTTHTAPILSEYFINAQHGVCVLHSRIIWHAIKTDFNALQHRMEGPSHSAPRSYSHCENQCSVASL